MLPMMMLRAVALMLETSELVTACQILQICGSIGSICTSGDKT